jgi:DNA-directed RNA polymerase subunit RPC12/RpoP
MGFKAEITIDKFEDYKELVSLGSKVVEVEVEKIVEVKVDADPVCPYCGSDDLAYNSKPEWLVCVNNGSNIPNQAIEVKCNDCGLIHPINGKFTQQINK